MAAAPVQPLLKSSKILNEQKFKEGGRILIVPFTPGVNAVASEELERTSMMIVRGLVESLGSQNSPFRILDAASADSADLVLQGRILTMKESGRLKKVALRKNKKYLAVEGSIIDAKSGNIVFHFTDIQESRDKKRSFSELGSAIGQDIGNFLAISID